jgi:hypothetical protein
MWAFTSTGGLPDLLNTPNGRCGGFLHFVDCFVEFVLSSSIENIAH